MSVAVPEQQQQKPGEEEQLTTEQQIVEEFNRKRREQSSIMQRIAEFESEIHEYNLVIEALKPLEDSRRCHRLVGGALIEKTAGEMRPDLQENASNCATAVKQLQDALVSKEKELEAFMTKYKISIKGGAQGAGQEVQAKEQKGGNAGLLA